MTAKKQGASSRGNAKKPKAKKSPAKPRARKSTARKAAQAAQAAPERAQGPRCRATVPGVTRCDQRGPHDEPDGKRIRWTTSTEYRQVAS